jgi:hypothetical protein
MKHMMIIVAALALAACTSDAAAPKPDSVTFICYADGVPTVIAQGIDISMHAELVDGRMVEDWTVSLPSTISGHHWYHHRAAPNEVCGPEVRAPPMVD